jgi:hypothetical protein
LVRLQLTHLRCLIHSADCSHASVLHANEQDPKRPDHLTFGQPLACSLARCHLARFTAHWLALHLWSTVNCPCLHARSKHFHHWLLAARSLTRNKFLAGTGTRRRNKENWHVAMLRNSPLQLGLPGGLLYHARQSLVQRSSLQHKACAQNNEEQEPCRKSNSHHQQAQGLGGVREVYTTQLNSPKGSSPGR